MKVFKLAWYAPKRIHGADGMYESYRHEPRSRLFATREAAERERDKFSEAWVLLGLTPVLPEILEEEVVE